MLNTLATQNLNRGMVISILRALRSGKTINRVNYLEFLLSEKTLAMEHILPAT